MSEVPTPPSGGFLRKKVLGVPVLYLVGGFVLILAAVAWKMKPSASSDAPADAPVEAADDTILTDSGTLPALPLGTVVAQQSTPVPDNVGNSGIESNDDWLRKGVAYMVSQGYTATEVQSALQIYLDAGDMSYQQGEIVNMTIKELGTPPYPVGVGTVASAPARVQGSIPRAHIVKSLSEDTTAELAALYYGVGDDWHSTLIARNNGGRTKFAIGDSVNIPALPVTPTKQGTPPLTHVVHIHQEDSAGELANLYYGVGRSWLPIAQANGGRTAFAIGQSVKIPVYPVPTK